MIRPATESDAMALFVRELPELAPLEADHIETYGELLPYVLLADCVRWYENRVRGGDRNSAQRFLAVVELLLTTDAEPPAADPVWNLTAVSFTESMDDDQEVVAESWGWMGPETRRMLQLTS